MQGNGALNCILFSIPQASCKLFHENLKGWRKKMRKQTISEFGRRSLRTLKTISLSCLQLGLSKNNFEGTTLICLKPAIEYFN